MRWWRKSRTRQWTRHMGLLWLTRQSLWLTELGIHLENNRDVLNRCTQDYGLISPPNPKKSKNVSWYFFRKYSQYLWGSRGRCFEPCRKGDGNVQRFQQKLWTCSWTCDCHVSHGYFGYPMNSSWTNDLCRSRTEHFFLRSHPQYFSFGCQEHGHQGYLHDFRRKKLLIHRRYVDDFRNEK